MEETLFLTEKQAHGGRPAPVAALRHGLAVLGAFTVAEPVLGVSEIARRIGSSKSTVYRALVTLEDAGLVQQDAANGRYRLAAGVVALAGALLANLDVRDVARPYLQRLAERSRESVNMSVWNRVEAVNIEQVPGPALIKHMAPLGRRNPAHASATGKVLLAHAPPEDLEAVLALGLPRLTDRTITEPVRLLAELEEVRRRGYAVNNHELEPEMVAVAAPVRDYQGPVIAAVSISAPSYRIGPDQLASLAQMAVETASEISRRLGYAGQAVDMVGAAPTMSTSSRR
jgi:DNA-binding IclR family transcriptional regulator